MTEQQSTENLPTINIGIVGHIDHGKTTLLQKLSGKWTDTHSQELKRGITIKLGYADIILYKDNKGYNREQGEPARHISFVDAPGHEMLMATMLSGAAIIDAAILVVAANEGIKPQTSEHVMALQAKRIKHLIVVQNKIDLVDKKRAQESYLEIKNFLKGKYDNAPIIPVSAQQEVNLDKIYEKLAAIPLDERKTQGPGIFIIARSFDINKPGTVPADLKGTVLGGTLKSGTLKEGEQLEIKPGLAIKEANQYHYKTLVAKALTLLKGSKRLSVLTPGGSMSIETSLDMSIGKADALSGCLAAPLGVLPTAVNSLRIKFTLFPEIHGSTGSQKIEPLKPSEMLLLSINTSMTLGVIKRLQGTEIELSLKVPAIAFKGDNIALSRSINGHWRLIGYGEIV
ncbi:translation initiation factor IF-2 subunit gamma [Candidatus Pacearchaeota archaeon]|nr:translation initiation factor IF-2 subunit gamma [Candidatus Pacearchaeota archaeon]